MCSADYYLHLFHTILDMVILYFLAIRFKLCAIVCKSSSDVAIKIWSSADYNTLNYLKDTVQCHHLKKVLLAVQAKNASNTRKLKRVI